MFNASPGFITRLGRSRLLLAACAALLLALAWQPWQPPKPKPLYWVSMDPNYRSDKPGKCPTAWDLVPVYAATTPGPAAGRAGGHHPAVQQQMAVRKVKVARGILTQRLRSFGRVVADPALVVPISPRTPVGLIRFTCKQKGRASTQGQPLFSVYSPQLIDAQEQFLAARRQARPGPARRTATGRFTDGRREPRHPQTTGRRPAQRDFHAPKDGVVDMIKLRDKAAFTPGQMVMAIGSMERVVVWLEVFASQGP